MNFIEKFNNLFRTDKKISVLSLCDGIACGRQAMKELGLKIDKYYASEIDKYAIQIAQKNHPDIEQLGDINNIDFKKFIGKIDIIIGGTPCQDLSIAKQNREGLKGSKSSLFYKYVEALKIIKPKYFLLENVANMKNEDKEIITETLKQIYDNTELIEIDSALLSAQQRKRYYWTNWHIEQPENNKKYLSDVVNIKTNQPYQDKILMKKINTTVKVRKYEVDIENLKILLRKHKNFSNKYIAEKLDQPITKVEHWFRTDKSFAIPDAEIWFKLKDILNIDDNSFDKSITEFEIRNSKYDMSNRVYHIAGKAPTLTTHTGGHQRKIIIDDEGNLSFLTPVHSERLQTLPDNYTEGISNTQRYKCIGNGWTVEVIKHILKQIF